MAPIAEKWFRSRRMNPPPLILSSPARRAKETVERISPSLYGTLGPVVFKENLYLPSIEDSLEVLRQQDDGIDRLAICSHNPGITRLAEYLFGPLPRDFAPCGMALGSLNFERWAEVSQGGGKLLESLNP